MLILCLPYPLIRYYDIPHAYCQYVMVLRYLWNIIAKNLTRKIGGFMSKTTMHSVPVLVYRIYRLTWSAFDTCNKCYAHVTGIDYPFHTHYIVEIKKRSTGEKNAQNIRQKASAFG